MGASDEALCSFVPYGVERGELMWHSWFQAVCPHPASLLWRTQNTLNQKAVYFPICQGLRLKTTSEVNTEYNLRGDPSP